MAIVLVEIVAVNRSSVVANRSRARANRNRSSVVAVIIPIIVLITVGSYKRGKKKKYNARRNAA